MRQLKNTSPFLNLRYKDIFFESHKKALLLMNCNFFVIIKIGNIFYRLAKVQVNHLPGIYTFKQILRLKMIFLIL